jgi:hypothetical protein
MTRPVALRVALDLARTPVLSRLAAGQSLPPGMIVLLRIAGDDAATIDEAAATTGEPPETIRHAVTQFLETVLFTPAADSYRLLGAERSATQAELRDHMRWLMKWLHPDRERSEWQSTLAMKISAAWDDLKSPERRRAYDEAHPVAPGPGRHSRRARIPWIGVANAPDDRTGRRRLFTRAAVVILLAGAAGLVAIVWDGPALLFGAVFADSLAGVRP